MDEGAGVGEELEDELETTTEVDKRRGECKRLKRDQERAATRGEGDEPRAPRSLRLNSAVSLSCAECCIPSAARPLTRVARASNPGQLPD